MKRNILTLALACALAAFAILAGCKNANSEKNDCFDAVNSLESYLIVTEITASNGLSSVMETRVKKDGNNYVVERKTTVPNEIGADEQYTTTKETATVSQDKVNKFNLQFKDLKNQTEVKSDGSTKLTMTEQQAKDLFFIDNVNGGGAVAVIALADGGKLSKVEITYVTDNGNAARTTITGL